MVTESEKSKHDMLRAMRKHIRENGITDFTDFHDGYNDYLFLLDMFNGGFCSEAQERKCQAIIMQSIYPWLRNLWKKSKSQKGKIDNGK